MSNNSKQNILIWTLSLAILLVLFLCLPTFDFGLSSSLSSTSIHQGVLFHGKITNAPKSEVHYDSYQEAELPVLTNSPATPSSHYSAFSSQRPTSFVNQRLSMNGNNFSNGISAIGQSGSVTNSNITVNSTVDLSALSGLNFKSSSPNQPINNPLFTAASEDLLAVSEMSNRQSAGGVDPGDDPTDPVLPVGDGYGFLMILAVGYLFWKLKKRESRSIEC